MSTRLSIGLLLCASLFARSKPAAAQQGDGFPDLGHIGPSNAEVVGIIVGAAVVIGAVVYLVVPKQKTIEGCIESGDGGLRLTSETDKRTYVLEPGAVSLQPGQQVVLRGKPGKKHSGSRDFAVKKRKKDKGSCSPHASVAS